MANKNKLNPNLFKKKSNKNFPKIILILIILPFLFTLFYSFITSTINYINESKLLDISTVSKKTEVDDKPILENFLEDTKTNTPITYEKIKVADLTSIPINEEFAQALEVEFANENKYQYTSDEIQLNSIKITAPGDPEKSLFFRDKNVSFSPIQSKYIFSGTIINKDELKIYENVKIQLTYFNDNGDSFECDKEIIIGKEGIYPSQTSSFSIKTDLPWEPKKLEVKITDTDTNKQTFDKEAYLKNIDIEYLDHKISPHSIVASFKVTNNNTYGALQNLQLSNTLVYDLGKTKYTQDNVFFSFYTLKPGESFILENEMYKTQTPEDVTFAIKDFSVIGLKDKRPEMDTLFNLDSLTYTDLTENGVLFNGKIKNISDAKNVINITLVAKCYNANGDLVAVERGLAAFSDPLEPNQETDFYLAFKTTEEIDSFEVFVLNFNEIY